MQYVISDIHGCYEEYMELLQKINLSQEDWLFILGDAIDRGPEPIKVIQDLMKRENITYIIGNHDYMFLHFMRKMKLGLLEIEKLSEEDLSDFYAYLEDGGSITLKRFMELSLEERESICEFFEDANVFDELLNFPSINHGIMPE